MSDQVEVQRIRVEVRSEILGDSVFWEGPATDIRRIHNIPARHTAALVAADGISRVCGMWHVSQCHAGEPAGEPK